MLVQLVFQGFRMYALHLFSYRIDAFLLQYTGYFIFGDKACIHRVFDNQLYVTAHLIGGFAIEYCHRYTQVDSDEQQNDR